MIIFKKNGTSISEDKEKLFLSASKYKTDLSFKTSISVDGSRYKKDTESDGKSQKN